MKRSLASEWRAGFLLLSRFTLAALIAVGAPLWVLPTLFTWVLGNPPPGPVYLLIFPGGLLVALGPGPILFLRVWRLLQVPDKAVVNSAEAAGAAQAGDGDVRAGVP
jgi:hypothetical protein